MFVNMQNHLERPRGESDWIKHEKYGDARIKNKGKYGINSLAVYYVVETESKLEEHIYNHPGRILLYDRIYIQDTPNGGYIKGTHELHEVNSIATSEKFQLRQQIMPPGNDLYWYPFFVLH